jgi:hypothetical protein
MSALLRLVPLQTESYAMLVPTMTREAWTDERLDDLNKKVDEGFKKVDARFDKVDARFDRLEGKLDAKFDALHRALWGGAVVIIAALLSGHLG